MAAYRLLLLLFLLNFSFSSAQRLKNTVLVESWETLEIDRNLPPIDSLIIKGRLIFKDRRNLKLKVSNIIIDGGYLEIGTAENPFTNKIDINFNLIDNISSSKSCSFVVKNGGRVSMFGISGEKISWTQLKNKLQTGNNILNLQELTNWQAKDELVIASLDDIYKSEVVTVNSIFNRELIIKDLIKYPHQDFILNTTNSKKLSPYIALLNRTININVDEIFPRHLVKTQFLFEDADQIIFSGVRFSGLNNKDKSRGLMHWSQSETNSIIKNCSFFDINADIFTLDNTTLGINDNVFYRNSGTPIHCAINGNGINNQIHNNLFIFDSYESNTSEAAIKIGNPIQSVKGNHIVGTRYAAGIVYQKAEKQTDRNWSAKNGKFTLEDNLIYNDISLKSSNTGILFEDFDHEEPWYLKNNIVVNYTRGIHLKTDQAYIQNSLLYNNTIGIITANAYLSKVEIQNPDKRLNIESRSIDIKGKEKLTAEISDVTINDYDIGISIEGNLGNTNSFQRIEFNNVKNSLYIEKIDLQSFINDLDNSLNSNTNGKTKGSQSILVSKDSFLRFDECQPLNAFNKIYSCELDKYGTLAITIGSALKTPIKNPNSAFENLRIEKGLVTTHILTDKNKKDLLLPVNSTHKLLFNDNDPIKNIRFSWQSNSNSETVISFPYSNKDIIAIRPFGGIITPSESLKTLKETNQLGYYIDKENKEIFIKLFSRFKNNTVIFYTYEKPDFKDFELELLGNSRKNQLNVKYTIPKGAATSFRVKDINGNTIRSFIDGVQKRKNIEFSINIEKYNLQNELRFYELSVNNQIYKGLLYTQ